MLNSELLTPVRNNRLDPEGRLGQLQQQLNTRRLVRSLCATISTLQVLSAESSPATRNSRILTSRHNKQLVVSPEDRASYGGRLTTNLPRLDVTALPVHDLPVVADHAPAPNCGLPASGLNIVEMISSDRSRRARATRTDQLETASLAFILPLMILASVMAASMANPSTIVLLGVQIIIGVVTTCIVWPGNGKLASATATLLNHSPAPSISSGMTISPTSSLLTVAASWLPLSTGSSRGSVSVCFPPLAFCQDYIAHCTDLNLVVESCFVKALSKYWYLSHVWGAEEDKCRIGMPATWVGFVLVPS